MLTAIYRGWAICVAIRGDLLIDEQYAVTLNNRQTVTCVCTVQMSVLLLHLINFHIKDMKEWKKPFDVYGDIFTHNPFSIDFTNVNPDLRYGVISDERWQNVLQSFHRVKLI